MSEDTAANENPSKRLKISIFFLPVKVVVGKTKIDFYLPKFLLCSQSPYLQTLCERYPNEIEFYFEDPEVFVLFASWLTTGNFESCAEYTMSVPGVEPARLRKGRISQVRQLVKAYLLGDRLRSVSFKNFVIDTLIDKLEDLTKDNDQALVLPHEVFSWVVACTWPKDPKSPLRRLFLNIGLKYLDFSNGSVTKHLVPKYQDDLLKYAVEQFRLTQTPNGAYTRSLSAEIVKEHYHEKLD